jgi:digeranylgeranylglycerophospholipid reductase
MVIGDAAHQVNPLTGGGISSAMSAGKKAGLIAADAIKKGDTSVKQLKRYQTEWNKTIGKDYKRFHRIKTWTLTLTDDDYEEIADALQGLSPDEVTLTKIFRAAVKNKPSLIVDVLKVFAGL